ncbi:MAG: aminotransferase class I/II-fold pyridoxal phosphate-dependent enzyme [Acidobacteriia bacterium]|nr:aminotransferase class I/II-fold pyridoxal phosphate-dependent enzyme [Terriglobia bacterium]
MQRKATVTRRAFIGGTTIGVASMGLGLPSLLDGSESPRTFKAKASEPVALLLDRNESSYGLSPGAARVLHNVAEGVSNRYPRDEPAALVEAISKRFGVEKEQVLLGCGSTEILKIATETFCSPSGAAIVAEPTFEAVVTYCPLAHARSVKIPLTEDYKHDLPKMLEAAALVGGFIFFCNPANPAGTYIGKEEVDKLVRRVPGGVVLLIDEAYFDYADAPDYESCVRYVKEGLPVLVSRTFSKIYGMAGLRLGYAIGHKDLIKQMSGRKLSSNANQIATAVALASLQEDDFVARIRRLNVQVRNSLCTELRAMGLEFIPSQTNFVMINLGRPVQPVIDALKQRGVIVGRLFPSMPNHLRVTFGTADDMKIFVKQFKAVLGSGAGPE